MLADAGEGRRERFFDWNPVGWCRLARIGLPLGISAFLASAITNVPRYFLEHDLGTNTLGLFAAMAYFVTFLSLAANAVAQTIAPRLGRALHEMDTGQFFRILSLLRVVAAGVTGAGVLLALAAGRPLIEMIYGEAFGEAAPLLPWIIVAGGLNSAAVFASYGMVAARRVYATLWALVFATTVCILSCWFLIEWLGLLGAVLGWIAGLATQLASFEFVLARHRSSLGPVRAEETAPPT